MTRKVKRVAIFDIDGCISNDEWRRGRIPQGASTAAEYAEYHAACADDAPLEVGKIILKSHIEQGDFIVFITARPFAVCKETSIWITNHFAIQPNRDFMVFMRRNDDERSAVDVKKELLEMATQYLVGYETDDQTPHIIAAYDDREDVCRMYQDQNVEGVKLLNRFACSEVGVLEDLQAAAKRPGLMNMESAFPLDLGGIQEIVNSAITKGDGSMPFTPGSMRDSIESLKVIEIKNPDLAPTFSEEKIDAAEHLRRAADLFEERNAAYKDNAVVVGRVMKALFPDGLYIKDEADHHFYHLFELMIVKLTRFTQSGLRHRDSMEDLIVYGAMVLPLLDQHSIIIEDGEDFE